MPGCLQSHARYQLVLWWPLVTGEADMGRFSWQVTASEATSSQGILFHSQVANTTSSVLKTCLMLITGVSCIYRGCN